MSYVVSIMRVNGPAVSVAEFRSAIEQDPAIEPPYSAEDAQGHACTATWIPAPGATPVTFVLDSGIVSVTTPSNAALRKMQALAARLNARVIGEEGEDLTEVAVPEHEFSPAASLTGCAIVILLGAAALWFAFSG